MVSEIAILTGDPDGLLKSQLIREPAPFGAPETGNEQLKHRRSSVMARAAVSLPDTIAPLPVRAITVWV
jgi:hypothetical protein